MSDSCEHKKYHLETGVTYHPTPEQIDRGTDHDEPYEIYVCDACDEALEDRDPVLDRLEAAYE